MAEKKFEASLTRLEYIVQELEKGDLPLEQSVGPAPFRDRGEQIRELTLIELFEQWRNPTGDFPKPRVDAEFNARLVRIASFLFLPALAFPLGIGSRRRRHGAELVIGAILLVLYHHLLQFGETLAQSGQMSPAVSLWLPFVAISSFSAWGIYMACQRPGDHPLATLLDGLNELPSRLRGGRRVLGGI